MDTPFALESRGNSRDELGQPSGTWTQVGQPLFASRLLPKANPETETADRPTETRTLSIRLHSQPFLALYKAGMRFRELPRTGFPETLWNITTWTETPHSGGMHIDVSLSTPEKN